MLAVVDQVPLAASYSSALPRTGPPKLLTPAATRTLPFESSEAVWFSRAVAKLDVVDQVPVAGSYNSALARTCEPPRLFSPPAARTLPFNSSVAVGCARGTAILPV